MGGGSGGAITASTGICATNTYSNIQVHFSHPVPGQIPSHRAGAKPTHASIRSQRHVSTPQREESARGVAER